MSSKKIRRSTVSDRLSRQDRILTVVGVLCAVGAVGALVVPLVTPSLTQSTKARVAGVTVQGYVTSTTQAASVADLVAAAPVRSTDPDGEPFVQAVVPTSTNATGPVVTRPIVTVAPFPSLPIAPLVVPANRAADLPVVVGFPEPVTSLNPHLAAGTSAANSAAATLVLPRPFRVGARGEPVLDQDLMASVTVLSAAPLVVRYVVRPDAVWSDAAPIGCHDFRLAWLAGSGRSPQFAGRVSTGFQRIAALGCSDDQRTITATFSEPDADWPWLFDGLLPAHQLMKAANIADLSVPLTPVQAKALAERWNADFDLSVSKSVAQVSGGPYLVSAVDSSGVTFAPNPAFWASSRASRSVKVVPVGDAGVIDQVRSGAIQVAGLAPDTASITAIQAGSGAGIVTSTGLVTEELVFNFRNPLLQQRGLREAIAACIERVGLVTSRVAPIVPGAEAAGNRTMRSYEPGYVDTALGRLGGIEVARQHLTKIGYAVGPDGVAVKNGKPLKLRVMFPTGGGLRAAVVDGIAQQCAPAGVALIVDQKSPDDVAKSVAAGDFDLMLSSSSSRLSIDERVGRYRTNAPSNLGRYAGTRINSLIQQLGAELDETRRLALLNDIDVQLWADVATVPLYSAPTLVVNATSVLGVAGVPGAAGALGTARNWR